LFAPLIYAFALHSARFARTSRCVGVPNASDASNAGYGRRVAPMQRQRGPRGANAALRAARIFFSR
jgi:hypothetical protein